MNYTDKSIDPEQLLKDLQIDLPAPPKPLGAYVECVRSGKLRSEERRVGKECW